LRFLRGAFYKDIESKYIHKKGAQYGKIAN